jgi:hypothetical protein
VRSAFEALLSIEYILETNYVQRSLSWLASYAHNRLEFDESLNPTKPKGQAFQKALTDDKIVRKIVLPPQDQVQAAIANLQHLLARPQFQEIEAEIKKHRKKSHWYQLFGGPKNLREPASHLNRQAQYHVFYRHWSSIAHAHDLSRFINKTPEGKGTYKMLRNPNDIQEVTLNTAIIILNATRLVLGKFRPGENLASWYEREVQKRFLSFATKGAC